MNLTVMKVYLYFILVVLSDSLAFFNVYGRADNSFDLLRILYLEKTSFKDFSFNPFPLFIMLSYTFNVILSVSYVTSNSLKIGNSFVLSRFNFCKRCYAFICVDTLKRVIFCSFVQSMFPALVSVCAVGLSDILSTTMLIMIYFTGQTVLLGYGVFTALLIERKLMSAAAIILGSLFILLLVITDTFVPHVLVLVDLSDNSLIMIAVEFVIFSSLLILNYFCFRKSKAKLDERL